jgi:hypothetical protein
VWHQHYSERNVYSKGFQIELPLFFTMNSAEEYLGVLYAWEQIVHQ